MRVVLQRVKRASVTVEGNITGAIEEGLLVLLGIEEADTLEDMLEVGGGLLLVSQFTLFAATKKGNRPSYSRAAPPAIALPIYEKMIELLSAELGKPIQTGVFGADMKVELLNDGPVTIVIDTKNKE